MFCPKCGQTLAEGSKFCGSCGATVNIAPPPAAPAQGAPAPDSNPSAPKFSNNQNTNPGPKPSGSSLKKKLPLKTLIIAAAAVVVVVIVIIVLVSVLGKSKKSDNAYVYLSSGSYELITNLKKGDSIEISSSRSSDTASGLVRFSSDGTYVYYFTKYDSSTNTGTLCRAEYAKLKDGSSKNEKYIETIASNVYLGFSLIDDDSVVYKTYDGTLYCYDGETSQEIADDISSYTISESTVVYTVYNTDDYTYNIYGVDLDDPDTTVKLAGNADYVYNTSDPENVFYSTEDSEGNETLYVVGMSSEAVELGEGLDFITTYNSTVYYAVENGETISLYDYVIDDYAATDASLTEPDIEDYVIPDYDYERLYYDDDNSDVTEYYTSCTNAITFYKSGWFCRSIQYAASYSNTYGEYYQAFYDKYIDQQDVYGYILVTDEVKADLITLVTSCGYEEGYWVECCFSREEDGTTYDYDAYDDDYDLWDSAADRIELREELQSAENAYNLKTLCRYEDGTVTAIAENVIDVAYGTGGFFSYNTTDNVVAQRDINDVSSISSITNNDFIADIDAGIYIYVYSSGETLTLSEEAADIYNEIDDYYYAYFYAAGDYLLLIDSMGAFYDTVVSDGVITDVELVCDDGEVFAVDDDTVYYVAEEYYPSFSNDYFGDIYKYDGETSTRIAQDVVTYYATIYEDGSLLVYTESEYYYDPEYELTYIDSKGEATVISDEVTSYVRVDSDTILYIANDNLYYYDGKDSTLVEYDVDYVWSLNNMSYIRSY